MILGLKGRQVSEKNSPPFFKNKKSLRKEAHLFR